MDKFLASELAYNNGFEAGKTSAQLTTAVNTRIKVAYEQLSKCHTKLCRTAPYYDNKELVEDFQGILNALLKLQVKLGLIDTEEDQE